MHERLVGAIREEAPKSIVGVDGTQWGVRNPDARIAGLLADAEAPLCLVQRPHDVRDCLPPGCSRLVVDEDLAAGAELPAPEIRDS